MKKCGVFILLAVALACGAHAQPSSENRAGTDAATLSAMDSHRDIVVAVANPTDSPAAHAGSNLLGYARRTNYVAGQRAISAIAAIKQRYGLREVAAWPIRTLNLYCVVLEPPTGASRDALLQSLAGHGGVALAQPLQDFSLLSDNAPDAHHYNDPYVDLQRGFAETDAALAHERSRGDGVRVAIVDTGVDLAHPELKARVGTTRNLVDDDSVSFDRDRHGTEVAGIIAAQGDNHQGIVGIAPDVTLSVYKACWYPLHAAARCNSFTLAKALAAVLDGDARIVNLSLGGPSDPLLGQLLAELVSQSRIVIAAMPPDGATDGFPGDVPGVIMVRVSGTPTRDDTVSAPGKDILTTEPGGGYDFASGSSLAAAHVSGIAALLLAMDPRLDASTVQHLLLRSSKISDGMLQVNAAEAVSELSEESRRVAIP